MNAKTFVDTNVLFYAHDVEAAEKRAIASGLLRQTVDGSHRHPQPAGGPGAYVNVTPKISRPLSKPSARAVVESYSVWCVDTIPVEISAVFRIEDEAGIRFWDALILSAPRKAGAARLLTEDLNAGQVIAGVRIENPFSV